MASFSNEPRRVHGGAQTFLRNLLDSERKNYIIVASALTSRFSKDGEQQLAILGADNTAYLGNPKDYTIFDDGHRQIGIYDNSSHSLNTVWKNSPELFRMMATQGPNGHGGTHFSFDDIFHEGAYGGYSRLSQYCIALAELKKDGFVETEPFRVGEDQTPLTSETLGGQWRAYQESELHKGTLLLSDALGTKNASEQREKLLALLRDTLLVIRQRPDVERERALYLICERILSKQPFEAQSEMAEWACHQRKEQLSIEDVKRGLAERIQYVTPDDLTEKGKKFAKKLHRYLLTADARHGNDALFKIIKDFDFASLQSLPRSIQEPPDKPYYYEERFHTDCTAEDFPQALQQAFESVGLKNAHGGLILSLDDEWQTENPIFEYENSVLLPYVKASPKMDVDKPVSISRNAWEAYFSVVDRRSERTESAWKYCIIPEAWVKEAYESDMSYLLKRRMLSDEKVLDYVYDHRPTDGEPFLAAVTDGIFDAAARDDDGFAYLDEPWRGNNETSHRIDDISCLVARFRLDDFQDKLSSSKELPILSMSAVRKAAKDYILNTKPARESDLTRGIAEAIRDKDYDELHSALDGFVNGESKAKKALKKTGRGLRKER